MSGSVLAFQASCLPIVAFTSSKARSRIIVAKHVMAGSRSHNHLFARKLVFSELRVLSLGAQ